MEDLYEVRDTPSQGRMCSVRCSNTTANQDELSVPASAVRETFDIHIAEQIWQKAVKRLSQKDAILPAPSRDTAVKAF